MLIPMEYTENCILNMRAQMRRLEGLIVDLYINSYIEEGFGALNRLTNVE